MTAEHERAAEEQELREMLAVDLADRFLCQPKDMAWEDRSDELADTAMTTFRVFAQILRDRRAAAVEQGAHLAG